MEEEIRKHLELGDVEAAFELLKNHISTLNDRKVGEDFVVLHSNYEINKNRQTVGLDYNKEFHAQAVAGILHLLDRGKKKEVGQGRKYRFKEELRKLRRWQIERIIHQLEVPFASQRLSDRSEKDERIDTLIQYCGQHLGFEILQLAIDQVRTKVSFREQIWLLIYRFLSLFLPGKWILKSMKKRFSEPYGANLVREYLKDFSSEMVEWNKGTLTYIPQNATIKQGSGKIGKDYVDSVSKASSIKRIRSELKQLSGLRKGGTMASAQIASLDSKSKVVRNASRVLMNASHPLIVLGDPGTGKSMTIREVGRRLADIQQHKRFPDMVVYIPLSTYTENNLAGDPGEIIELVRKNIPDHFRRLKDLVPYLMEKGKLILLFDGMDEMVRDKYGTRIKKLSQFAENRFPKVKTLFACRINDFSPEFEHKQLILLPFDKKRVRKYVRNNFSFPLRIDGKSLSEAEFLTRLYEQEDVVGQITNPFSLFLVTNYIKENEAFPEDKTDLFRRYFYSVFRNVLPDIDDEKIDHLLEVHSEFAFLITSQISGAFGTVTGLDWNSDPAEAADSLEIGKRAGLLLPSPGQEESFRFSHHRLQEFLTAYYISKNPSLELDWDQLLAVPRWQETLIYLISIDQETRALDTLESYLRSIPEISWPSTESTLDIRQESDFGDRLVLASRVIQAVGKPKGKLPASFIYRFSKALEFLSEKGNPISLIKVLWCWKNAILLSLPDPFPQAMNSEVQWVRNQALALLGSNMVLKKRLKEFLPNQILHDLNSRKFLGKIPFYLKFIREHQPRKGLKQLFAGMVFSFLGYVMVWTTTILILWGIIVVYPIDGISFEGYFLILIALTISLAYLFATGPLIDELGYPACFLTLFALFILPKGNPYGVELEYFISFSWGVIGFIYSIFSVVTHFGFTWLFLGNIGNVKLINAKTKALGNDYKSIGFHFSTLRTIAICYLGMIIGEVIVAWEAVFALNGVSRIWFVAFLGFLLFWFMIDIVGLGSFFEDNPEGDSSFGKRLIVFMVGLFLLGLIYGGIILIAVYKDDIPAIYWIMISLLTILFLVSIIAISVKFYNGYLKYKLRLIRLSSPSLAITYLERTSNPFSQERALRSLTPRRFEMSNSEFKSFLEELESHITNKEPVHSTYWKLRFEIENIIRQEIEDI